jgi:hypothetical protein
MTKMVETKDHSFVLRSEIISMRKYGRKGKECEISTKHGKKYVVKKSAEELASESEFEEEAISAEPGYFVLTMNTLSRKLEDFQKLPVVGWVKFRFTDEKSNLGASSFSLPIVAGGYALHALDLDICQVGLVLPDGRVIDTRNYREYESVETFVKKRRTAIKIPKDKL